MTIADQVLQKVLALPEAKQKEVLDYVNGLQQGRRKLADPEGLLKGRLPELSLADFQKARREMWKPLPLGEGGSA